MDYREFMSFAPKGCQPTIITKQSILEEGAKKLGKTVEEMTEEEKEAEFEAYRKVCCLPTDFP